MSRVCMCSRFYARSFTGLHLVFLEKRPDGRKENIFVFLLTKVTKQK